MQELACKDIFLPRVLLLFCASVNSYIFIEEIAFASNMLDFILDGGYSQYSG